MVSNRRGGEELVRAVSVFTVGGTADVDGVIRIFKHFGRLVVEAERVAWVVGNDVLIVSDTVRALEEWGDVVCKGLVTNARLTEVD